MRTEKKSFPKTLANKSPPELRYINSDKIASFDRQQTTDNRKRPKACRCADWK